MADAPTPADSSSALDHARKRRDHLLATELLFNAADLQRLGHPVETPSVGRPRRRLPGLIGFWNGTEFLYPRCQFERHSFAPRAQIAPILKLVSNDPTGWRLGFWLYQPHQLLDAARPADTLVHDPERVLAAARSDFEPNDTRW